jgi:hypothetical protein
MRWRIQAWADSYDILGDMEVWPARKPSREAGKAVYKALELDPGLPEAIAAQWLARSGELGLARFERDLRQAIQLKAELSTGPSLVRCSPSVAGPREEALAEMKRAWELNPMHQVRTLRARNDYWCRRYDDAMRQSQKTTRAGARLAVSALAYRTRI